jgi:hypothetical protein
MYGVFTEIQVRRLIAAAPMPNLVLLIQHLVVLKSCGQPIASLWNWHWMTLNRLRSRLLMMAVTIFDESTIKD